MDVDQAPYLLPDSPELSARCRALAVLDVICRPRPGEGYRLLAPGATHPCHVLTMVSERRCLDVHLSDDGAVAYGWDADLAAYLSHDSVRASLLPALPRELRPCLHSRRTWLGDGDGLPLTFLLWRSGTGARWNSVPLPVPAGAGAQVGDETVADLLRDLICPSPERAVHSGCPGPDAGAPPTGSGLTRARAVRHVLAGRPLTEQVVRALDPERRLEEVYADLDAAGLRLADDDTWFHPLDQGWGEGAPLVTAGTPTPGQWFRLEPHEAGGHRILAQHSGKSLWAVAGRSGAQVVQTEPGEDWGQRFLVQRADDESYRPAAGWREGEEYRILAADSGLALQAPHRPGDPVVLAAPNHDDAQRFRAVPTLHHGYHTLVALGSGARLAVASGERGPGDAAARCAAPPPARRRPRAGGRLSDEILRCQDASGRITTVLFRLRSPQSASHVRDLRVEVADDLVVVGGGAVTEDGLPGALLTASRPSDDGRAWTVSSKDHLMPMPHRLTGYAIGMKIDGVGRRRLQRELLTVCRARSMPVPHPVVSVAVPDGHTLIGGGFRANGDTGEPPYGVGQLVAASFPELGEVWTARSKDHLVSHPCTLDVYAVGLRSVFALDSGELCVVRRDSVVARSGGPSSRPLASAVAPAACALTGIGADLHPREPGALLWRLEPVADAGRPGVAAGGRGHEAPAPTMLTAYALGIRLVAVADGPAAPRRL
jgi:hypothetical protein